MRDMFIVSVFMAKRRSIVWKFFDLVKQEKDGIKVKNASCKIRVDMELAT